MGIGTHSLNRLVVVGVTGALLVVSWVYLDLARFVRGEGFRADYRLNRTVIKQQHLYRILSHNKPGSGGGQRDDNDVTGATTGTVVASFSTEMRCMRDNMTRLGDAISVKNCAENILALQQPGVGKRCGVHYLSMQGHECWCVFVDASCSDSLEPRLYGESLPVFKICGDAFTDEQMKKWSRIVDRSSLTQEHPKTMPNGGYSHIAIDNACVSHTDGSVLVFDNPEVDHESCPIGLDRGSTSVFLSTLQEPRGDDLELFINKSVFIRSVKSPKSGINAILDWASVRWRDDVDGLILLSQTMPSQMHGRDIHASMTTSLWHSAVEPLIDCWERLLHQGFGPGNCPNFEVAIANYGLGPRYSWKDYGALPFFRAISMSESNLISFDDLFQKKVDLDVIKDESNQFKTTDVETLHGQEISCFKKIHINFRHGGFPLQVRRTGVRFAGLGDCVLNVYGLKNRSNPALLPESTKRLRVSIMNRRCKRELLNVPQLIAELKKLEFDVNEWFFEDLPSSKQLQIASHTDIMIAAHGGGEAWMSMLPRTSVFIEIRAQQLSRCWIYFQSWIDVNYKQLEIEQVQNESSTPSCHRGEDVDAMMFNLTWSNVSQTIHEAANEVRAALRKTSSFIDVNADGSGAKHSINTDTKYVNEREQVDSLVNRAWDTDVADARIAYGAYGCPHQIGNRMHTFLNGFAIAVVSNRKLRASWEPGPYNTRGPEACEEAGLHLQLPRSGRPQGWNKRINENDYLWCSPNFDDPSTKSVYATRAEWPLAGAYKVKGAMLSSASRARADGLFALGVHYAYGAMLLKAFKFDDVSVVQSNREALDNAQASKTFNVGIHIRHHKWVNEKNVLLQLNKLLLSDIVSKPCAVLIATEKNETVSALQNLSTECGCVSVTSVRELPPRESHELREHGQYTGISAVRDIHLLGTASDLFVGTSTSTFSVLIAHVFAATRRQRGSSSAPIHWIMRNGPIRRDDFGNSTTPLMQGIVTGTASC